MNQQYHEHIWSLIRYAPLNIGLHNPLSQFKEKLVETFDQHTEYLINDYKSSSNIDILRHLMRLYQYVYAHPLHARRVYDYILRILTEL